MRGSLFTRDFLNEGIQQTDAWNALTSSETERFREQLADRPSAPCQPNRGSRPLDSLIAFISIVD